MSTTYTPIVKDRDKDLLDRTIDDINIRQVEYLASDIDQNEIQIIITGTVHDDESKAIKDRSTKPAHDAFDRAMQGL